MTAHAPSTIRTAAPYDMSDRRWTHTYRCVGTRADRHQCRREVSAFSDDGAYAAERAARDRAERAGWAVNGGDWTLAGARGLTCPRHS